MVKAIEVSIPCPICSYPVLFTMVESIEWSFPEGLIPRVTLTIRSTEGLGDTNTRSHWHGTCGESFAERKDTLAPEIRCSICGHTDTIHSVNGCLADSGAYVTSLCGCMSTVEDVRGQ